MSKMDNLRAMREAKYERAAAAGKAAAKGGAPTRSVPVAPPAAKQVSKPVAPVADDATATDELCGHRNMSGRTCTREKGHAAKSHRYS